MGALPTIKRFLAEDFPTESGWITTLLYPLNLLLNTIYANLNNGITFQQNILSQIKTISISGLAPSTTFNWSFSNVQAPIGVLVLQCLQTDSPVAVITSAVTVAWSYSAGVISINNMTGLNSSHTYSVTFLVIGG